MDFDKIVTSVGKQFAVIWQAPVPFAVCLAIGLYLVWRVMRWQYAVQIERLRNDAIWLQARLERQDSDRAHITPAEPVSSPTAHPAITKSNQENEKRVFVPGGVTLAKLIALRIKEQSISVDRQLASYLGMWIQFEEVVTSTALSYGEANVRVQIGEHKNISDVLRNQATLWFPKAPPEIDLLQPGDLVKGVGRIQDLSGIGPSLSDCELT